MSVFTDPENLQKEIDDIPTFKTLEEVKTRVDAVLPGWFMGVISKYSSDYDVLTENWKSITDTNKCTPKSILICADQEFMNPDHKLSSIYGDLFTKVGFCVRRSSDIITCVSCNSAIPCEALYNLLKEKCPTRVPTTWSNKCSSCYTTITATPTTATPLLCL
jgi:hypothetical protein